MRQRIADPSRLFASAADAAGLADATELARALGRAGQAVTRRRAWNWLTGAVWPPLFAWRAVGVAEPPPAPPAPGLRRDRTVGAELSAFGQAAQAAGFGTAVELADALSVDAKQRQSERTVQDWYAGRREPPPAAWAWLRLQQAKRARPAPT